MPQLQPHGALANSTRRRIGGVARTATFVLTSASVSCGARSSLATWRDTPDGESSSAVYTSSSTPSLVTPGAAATNTPPQVVPTFAPPSTIGSTTEVTSQPTLAPSGSPSTTPVELEIVGKPSEESMYHHALPPEGVLTPIAGFFDEDEGLPYPYRELEWSNLGAPEGELDGTLGVSLGPENEIYLHQVYVDPMSERKVARYSAETGWTWESMPVVGGRNITRISHIEVTPDGIAWAATDAALMTRVNGQWRLAESSNRLLDNLSGIHFDISGTRSVAFRSYDSFFSEDRTFWQRIDGDLPLFRAGVAYTRDWQYWHVGANTVIAASDDEVLTTDGATTDVYAFESHGVGIGHAGEFLVVGRYEFAVSKSRGKWELFPIQIGGARGGGFELKALAMSPRGDAYVSGTYDGFFHRFADGSMELLNAPGRPRTCDASDAMLVTFIDDGLWQARPQLGAVSSGVFEAVIPRDYRSEGLTTEVWGVVDIPRQLTPPNCFDRNLGGATGTQLHRLSDTQPERMLFRAPHSGTFQFRLEAGEGPSAPPVHDRVLSIWTDCLPTNHQRGNPIHVDLLEGQYLVVHGPTPGVASSGAVHPEIWLSIY